ncbi:MAG: LamB/YcsF family protein [Martelella sp.]
MLFFDRLAHYDSAEQPFVLFLFRLTGTKRRYWPYRATTDDWPLTSGKSDIEAYADRGYGPDGRILPRSNPQALITDPHQAADQVISIVRDHCVPVAGRKTCPLEAQSVCFHADTPNADAFAHTIRTRLEEAGITIAPPPPSAEK